MSKITVLPHAEICPEGTTFEAPEGANLIQELLSRGIRIEHACEMQCACTTCHVYVREGFDDLTPATEKEEDLLDKAWGLDLDSRLSCQTIVPSCDLVIELPKYTLNMVSESG